MRKRLGTTDEAIAATILSCHSPVIFYNSGGIGDHLLSLPSLRALAKQFAAPLRLVCVKGSEDVFFSHIPNVQAVVTPFYTSNGREIAGIGLPNGTGRVEGSHENESDVMRYVRHTPWTLNVERLASVVRKCDLAISLTPWHSTVFEEFCRLARPTFTVAYNSGHTISLESQPSIHFADDCFACPQALCPTLKLADYWSGPVVYRQAYTRAREILAQFPRGVRLLAVHCETKSDKLWEDKRFFAVIEMFLTRRKDFAVLLVGQRCDEMWRHHARVLVCTTLDIGTSLALVACSDLFLGIDSCMLHCADLHLIPSVGLFLSSALKRYGFRLAASQSFAASNLREIDCAPVLDALERIATLSDQDSIHRYDRISSGVPDRS